MNFRRITEAFHALDDCCAGYSEFHALVYDRFVHGPSVVTVAARQQNAYISLAGCFIEFKTWTGRRFTHQADRVRHSDVTISPSPSIPATISSARAMFSGESIIEIMMGASSD